MAAKNKRAMKKILVVDDRPEVRELIGFTLELDPYEVFFADGGQQALEKARSILPDLVLLDVVMPDGPDGLEVCEMLKSDIRTRHILIILLTSKGQIWDLQAGYQAGADHYMVKPFSPSELLDIIRKMLREPDRQENDSTSPNTSPPGNNSMPPASYRTSPA